MKWRSSTNPSGGEGIGRASLRIGLQVASSGLADLSSKGGTREAQLSTKDGRALEFKPTPPIVG